MPPARAIAIAIRASVTVSMFAATVGAAIVMRRVKREAVETSLRDCTPERRGTRRTSS